MDRLFEVIAEDADLLVINKPAGLVCHPTKGDQYSSLISRVRLYLSPEVKAHLVNRLDRETSGVVLVAKTDAAALELRRALESRQVQKEYLGIVHGHLPTEKLILDGPIGKDPQRIVAIKGSVRSDGAASETEIVRLKNFTRDGGAFALVRALPRTGRTHQIRIHLAHAGHPIVGDKIYGSDEQAYLRFVRHALTEEDRRRLIFEHQALHSAAVGFPWREGYRRYESGPEEWFARFVNEHINAS